MDYRLYHALNLFVVDHPWLGTALHAVEQWAVPLVIAATVGLWLLARPTGARKWKLTTACALASAGLALLANQVIAQLWQRSRPYAAHPSAPAGLEAESRPVAHRLHQVGHTDRHLENAEIRHVGRHGGVDLPHGSALAAEGPDGR